jgi:hypothetical protein
MGYWIKARKDIEAVLEHFHQAGWRITDPPKYYTVKCPCGKHKRWIHRTPSDPNYPKNALAWLERQPCYKERGNR